MQRLLGNSPFHTWTNFHLQKIVYKGEIVSFSRKGRQIHTATWNELTKPAFGRNIVLQEGVLQEDMLCDSMQDAERTVT